MTQHLATIALKAYVPAKDFTLSKQFYTDLGFTMGWSSDDMAPFQAGPAACSGVLPKR